MPYISPSSTRDESRCAAEPAELKASLASATLDEVFVQYSALGEAGHLRDTAQTRRTARRLG